MYRDDICLRSKATGLFVGFESASLNANYTRAIIKRGKTGWTICNSQFASS